MAAKHPLPAGTAVRFRTETLGLAVFGEPRAPAGSVGFIDRVSARAGHVYTVMIEPCGIWGFWSQAEVDAAVDVLPEDHPDIPPKAHRALFAAVRDLISDAEPDDDSQSAAVSTAALERVGELASGTVYGRAVGDVLATVPRTHSVCVVPCPKIDALAEAVGVADRLSLPYDAPPPTRP